jgi:CRP-like cAMP-binding protein
MMTIEQGPAGSMFRNEILAALPAREIEALRPLLNGVTLISGQVLHEPDNPITDVFFVEAGVVSLTANTLDDGQVEVGLTGREGLVGVSVMLNSKPVSVHRAFTQVPGFANRMSSVALRAAVKQSPILRDRCLRSVEMVMVESSQVAACNARHNLPKRMARWLLMVRDRLDSDNIPMTQEFLSVMLGVRRSGVSVAANTLQAAGLISQSRGHVTIADHAGLAAASCDCYRIIRQTQDRILGMYDCVHPSVLHRTRSRDLASTNL